MENLEIIEEYAHTHNIPIIRPNTLKYLLDCVAKNNPKTILEIGTAIGYSGAKMLGVCDAKLTTIEKSAQSHELANQNFSCLGLEDRVECILGDAGEEIVRLEKAGRKFDFVFLDGPKGQYIKYLPHLTNLLNMGGIIFADNVLFRGMVNSEDFIPHRNRTIVVNLRAYLSQVSKPPYVSETYDIEDGFCISKKVE